MIFERLLGVDTAEQSYVVDGTSEDALRRIQVALAREPVAGWVRGRRLVVEAQRHGIGVPLTVVFMGVVVASEATTLRGRYRFSGAGTRFAAFWLGFAVLINVLILWAQLTGRASLDVSLVLPASFIPMGIWMLRHAAVIASIDRPLIDAVIRRALADRGVVATSPVQVAGPSLADHLGMVLGTAVAGFAVSTAVWSVLAFAFTPASVSAKALSAVVFLSGASVFFALWLESWKRYWARWRASSPRSE